MSSLLCDRNRDADVVTTGTIRRVMTLKPFWPKKPTIRTDERIAGGLDIGLGGSFAASENE